MQATAEYAINAINEIITLGMNGATAEAIIEKLQEAQREIGALYEDAYRWKQYLYSEYEEEE